jgi:hypothetical protein
MALSGRQERSAEMSAIRSKADMDWEKRDIIRTCANVRI